MICRADADPKPMPDPAGSLPACDNPGGSELLTDTSRDAHRTLKTRPARTKILQRS
jgi:hypothetical protein